MGRVETIYVFYRGDEVIFVGTIEECVVHFKIKREMVIGYATPSMRKRGDKPGSNAMYAVKIKV